MIAVIGTLLSGICIQECPAAPTDNYRTVTVPFHCQKNDDDFRPHQVVIADIQTGIASPPAKATLVFDTGTDHSCISASLARKLGLTPIPAMVGGITLNLNGQPTLAVKVARLYLGELQINNFQFVVLPDQQLPEDGILGTDLCSAFPVNINFSSSSLVFIVPSGTTFDYDTLNALPTTVSSSYIANLGFGAAVIAPMIKYGNDFFANVVLRNGSVTATDLLGIDSGGVWTRLSAQTWQKLKLETVAKKGDSGLTGKFTEEVAWLSYLGCGGIDTDNLLVVYSPDEYQQAHPSLCLDILASYDVLLDFPHQKMYLKPRTDLQAITLRQYEAASSARRRQWVQNPLYVFYPISSRDFGTAIPYDLTSNGLPLAQVRLNLATPPVSFLLRSSTDSVIITESLAKQWQLNLETPLDDAKKPRLIDGYSLHTAQIPSFQIGGAKAKGEIGVLPDAGLLPYTSYLPLSGVVGAGIFSEHPLLMDPVTQTWMRLTGFHPEDLPSLEMADATRVDILDPDKDGIPAIAVEEQKGAAQGTDTMTLATGSPFTLLSAKSAQDLKLTPEPHKLTYGAGEDITVFNQAHLSQISIGSIVLKDVLVAYPVGAMPSDFYPRLGMNVISRLRLLVDAPGKKMYVKKVGE